MQTPTVTPGENVTYEAGSPKVVSVTVGAQDGSLTSGTAGSVTYPITVTRDTANDGFTATLSVTTGLPTGANPTFSPSQLHREIKIFHQKHLL